MDKFKAFGEILWLWSCSSLHSKWPLSSATSYVIPAIELAQYHILYASDGTPRAYVSWAYLSADAEKRYILDPTSLKIDDFKSGDRLWFIDFISPFGFADTIKLRREMSKIHGKDYLARSIRLRPNGKAVILEHSAGSKDKDKSRELSKRYYEEAMKAFKFEN